MRWWLTGYGAVFIKNDGDGNRVPEASGGVTTKYLVDTLNPADDAQGWTKWWARR